ncbi:MAG: hypothetical protein K2L02_06530, partial [Clostridia bacterium]|nr:hypothetical protein [Clostridia bacterium]
MKLKKTTGLLLALTLSASAFASVGVNIAATADEPATPPAAESAVEFNTENASLHLPETYEQYLPLENPSYIALNKNHIAVADQSLMYVYDREAGRYDVYRHYVSGTQVTISKIQFTDDGKLYFRDINNLYEYNFTTGTAEIVNNMGNYTFLIQGGYLYMAHSSLIGAGSVDFSYVPVDNISLENRAFLVQDLTANDPHMAYANGTLYCIINNNTVNAYDGETHQYLGDGKLDNSRQQISGLKFVCAYQDKFFYTVSGAGSTPNGLYQTDLNGNAKCIKEGDGYSSITTYNDRLYCVCGKTIREMEVTEDGVRETGYEIAAASSSRHRLNGAGETVRTKELVAIADTNNNRVSLYNRLENSYTTIDCIDENGAFVPEHIAIDKEEVTVKANDDVVTSNKIAVSNGNRIYEYNYERHSLYPEENGVTDKTPSPFVATDSEKNKITDLTYVYGECYYITGNNNGYGSTGTNSQFNFSVAGKAPTAITSDVYGTIYVAFDNQIYTLSESDFKNGGNETYYLTLSENAAPVYTSLSVDYEGHVWYLDFEGKLYCNKELKAQIDGKDFVFTGKDQDTGEVKHDYPSSFAISFEDDEIYFNFQNYVVKTNAYALESLPALNKILAGEAKTKTFDLADCDKLFVKVPANSVGFQIDLNNLKKDKSELGKYFPYESYFRLKNETAGGAEIVYRQGALLYEPQDEDGYYVVALYNV